MITPKYKIHDIVQMRNNFSFSPASNTISIGQIEAIHISSKYNKGFLTPKYQIIYSVSGFSLRPGEEQITLYKGELINE